MSFNKNVGLVYLSVLSALA